MDLKKLFSDRGKLFWLFGLALNVIWAILVFAILDEPQIKIYFNSDTLYLPSIYKDLFVDGGTFRGWNLNAAPNFFPDMVSYLSVNALFGNFRLAMLVFSVLQYMVILVLLSVAFKQISKNITYWHLGLGLIFILLILLVTPIVGDFVFTFYLLSISYHLGPFINTLLCLILLFRYIDKPSAKRLIWLAMVVLLAVFSNRLFVVMFIFPSLGTAIILFLRGYRFQNLKILGSLIVVTALSIGLFNLVQGLGYIHIISTGWKMFNFSNIWSSLDIMAGQHGRYLQLMDLRGILVALSLISFFAMCVIAVQRIGISWKKPLMAENKEAFYILFFILFFLIVLFTPIINGSYVGWAILRYNVHVFYLSLFNFVFIAYYLSSRKIANTIIKLTAVGVALVFAGYAVLTIYRNDVKTNLTNFVNYYPETVRCIDEFGLAHGVQYGIAEYWYAKRTTMFSKNNMRVYTVFPDVKPWYHVMNQNWYFKDGKGKYGNPEFRFVVTNALDREKIINTFGQPELTYECMPAEVNIALYPDFEFDRATRSPYIPK
jgi:hypothetical protein